MSFLRFVLTPRIANRKTDIWIVRSASTGSSLGRIRWFGAWRKYCFDPDPNTTFDCGCLREIAEYCETSTNLHKADSGTPMKEVSRG